MFCPACEEEISSPQPDGICLTCGEELIASPNASRQSERRSTERQGDDNAATTAMALLASSMENATAINPSSLMPLVNQLRGAPGLGDEGNNNVDDLAGILPPEALNPQAGTSASRPASQAALDNLKRIVLTPQSSELFEAQVSLFGPRPVNDFSPSLPGGNRSEILTLNAVPGEFGPITSAASINEKPNKIDDQRSQKINSPPSPRTAALVLCSPRTTKGGKLSPQTLSEIANLRQHRMPFIAYVERGDGVTFVQKAIVCQRAGESSENATKPNAKIRDSLCIGIIIGNSASGGGREVWPYIMQDTKKEAQKFGLKVPVVMIRREDGVRLVQWANRKDNGNNSLYTPCQINVRSKRANSHTCPVCTESYATGDTIIRLPLCGHVFHERCALAWLTKHNTCPYCRRELPTDDEDYERERRRREAIGSGDAVSGDDNGHNFYG